jgi:hypothetical protein
MNPESKRGLFLASSRVLHDFKATHGYKLHHRKREFESKRYAKAPVVTRASLRPDSRTGADHGSTPDSGGIDSRFSKISFYVLCRGSSELK